MIIGIYPENVCMIVAKMVVDSTLVCLAAASTWSYISNQEHLGTWRARKHVNDVNVNKMLMFKVPLVKC